MATLHISEADAVRDFATLLAHVRAGAEVVIQDENSTIAVIVPMIGQTGNPAEPEPGYDEWFRAEVQKGLDCDPATDIDGEQVEAHFAERRRHPCSNLRGTWSEAAMVRAGGS